MKILALDCSAAPASCAVWEDGRLLAECYIHVKLTHSQTLMPMVEGMLAAAHLALSDMDGFAVSAGPGSFTGVRIGVAACKGMAWPLQKPCAAVSTLEAMAENLRDADQPERTAASRITGADRPIVSADDVDTSRRLNVPAAPADGSDVSCGWVEPDAPGLLSSSAAPADAPEASRGLVEPSIPAGRADSAGGLDGPDAVEPEEADALLCCVMDARCNQVYNALFLRNKGEIRRLTPDRALLIEELDKELAGYGSLPVILAGDGAELCHKRLETPTRLAPEALRFQRASGVAAAAARLLTFGKGLSAEALQPVYLRLPQAERELKRRGTLPR